MFPCSNVSVCAALAKADGTKPMMRIKMASSSNRNELVFPLILMVLVVFPFRTTKGLDRELLVWLLYLLAIGQKCSNYQPSQYVERDSKARPKTPTASKVLPIEGLESREFEMLPPQAFIEML